MPTNKTFLIAGKRQDTDQIFLTSKSVYKGGTIFHNNNFSTLIKLPLDFYKKYFTFDRSTNIYRTKLKFQDIKRFCTIINHN